MNHTRRPPSSDLHAPLMVLDFAAESMPGQRLLFAHAHALELAWQAHEVLPALQRIEQAVQQGAWAVGYIAYEAAAGLDPALARAMRPPQAPLASLAPHASHAPYAPHTAQLPQAATPPTPATPLLAFALFTGPDTEAPSYNSAQPYAGGLPAQHPCPAPAAHAAPPDATGTACPQPPQWQLSESLADYVAKVNHLRAAIAAGDLYQVNYTLRADAATNPDFSPWLYYEALRQRQQCRYGAFLDFGSYRILSLSPELFFDWNRSTGTITTRPMKGTAPRGATPDADAAQARALQTSAKERAENVMIVDLLRNDLGRIAQTGSVHVPQLLHTEPYPTLWQMTSTVQATTRPGTSLTQVLQALFPCGSITGAPKHMSMQKIAATEPLPRGVYCGAVGFIHKDRALFNVAIRTITHTQAAASATGASATSAASSATTAQGGHMRCGTGGGITWPAQAEAEYAEAQLKLRFLHTAPLPAPDFALRETLLLAHGRFALLPLHLQRMAQSAQTCHFWPVSHRQRMQALQDFAAQHSQGLWRVALTQTAGGQLTVEGSPLADAPWALQTDWAESDALPAHWLQPPAPHTGGAQPVAVAAQANTVDACWLLHKTTRRAHYDAALAAAPGAWDVILHNAAGFATECTRGNLVLQTANGCITPPLAHALLPGTLRAALLARGLLREEPIPVQRLLHPQPHDRLWFINSVRGWLPLELMAARADGSCR